MSHKEKVKIARSLMTNEEIIDKIPMFSSVGWMRRKVDIRLAVIKRVDRARERRANRISLSKVKI